MRRWPAIAVGALLLSACAERETVMHWQTAATSSSAAPAAQRWPAAPEAARYELVGVLTGEANFGPPDGHHEGRFEKALRWIAGLGAGDERSKRTLLRPQGGIVDEAGRICVTDVGRRAVFVFDERAGRLAVWEQADEHATFMAPIGVAAGANGELLVADSALGRVVRLGRDGAPLGSIGKGALGRPTGVARDAARGRIYVADTAAHDIAVFDDAGRLLQRLGRRGVAAGEYNAPTFLAFAGGRLVVSDTANARVQLVDDTGAASPVLIGRRGLYVGNLTRPKGVARDVDGNVYVVESFYDHLLVFDAEGHFLLPIGGGDAGLGPFYLPAGVWTDGARRVFLADMFNGRVVVLRYLEAPT
jgi:DNA-binding beta-propeller fold protein YncE